MQKFGKLKEVSTLKKKFQKMLPKIANHKNLPQNEKAHFD